MSEREKLLAAWVRADAEWYRTYAERCRILDEHARADAEQDRTYNALRDYDSVPEPGAVSP